MVVERFCTTPLGVEVVVVVVVCDELEDAGGVTATGAGGGGGVVLYSVVVVVSLVALGPHDVQMAIANADIAITPHDTAFFISVLSPRL